jgi:hypothetical protein
MSITYTVIRVEGNERQLRAAIKRLSATECEAKEISPGKIVFDKTDEKRKKLVAMLKANQIWTINADRLIAACLLKYKIPFAVYYRTFGSSKEAAEEFKKLI